VYSSDNQTAVLQTLENTYVGSAMLAVMAQQQNRPDTRAECLMAQQRCYEAMIEGESDPDGMDFETTNELLEHVSKLARGLWNMQMSFVGEQINLRIVNDIADAERHIQRPESAAEIPCPSPIGSLIDRLVGSREATENPSPYRKMLIENDDRILDEGKRAASEVADREDQAQATKPKTDQSHDAGGSESYEKPTRTCIKAFLPTDKPSLSTIEVFQDWLDDVDRAHALPDTEVFIKTLDLCESQTNRNRQHASTLAEDWSAQFTNLPRDWVEDAARIVVNAACSTELDTFNDRAIDRIRACINSIPIVIGEDTQETPDTHKDNPEPGIESVDDLEERRENLLAELEKIDEAIDSRSSSQFSSPR
jgi:hypothetical protein